MNKLRIMFSSNAPWSTSGYGQQMKEILPLIAKDYPTACICFYGLEGGKIILDGITMYPKIADMWGSDAIVHHSQDFKADVVITFQDIWVVNPQALQDVGKHSKWIPYVPIDHEPVPPSILNRLKSAYRVITYAPFGQRELRRRGIHSTYIPHTIDTKQFRKGDKKEIRKKLGIPEDIFLFGMVAANKDNPSRKSFQEVMDAYVLFLRNHPNSGLYFHTQLNQDKGFPIEEYAKFLGIQDHIYKAPVYDMLYKIGREDMYQIYSCFDCLLAPSQNEGFGVPLIEAQACEVPVITSKFTAMRDLIIEGETGYFVETNYKRFTPLLSYVSVPSVSSIYKAMEKIFSRNREEMGKKAREFVMQFDTNKVYKESWSPFFEKLESELVDSKK